MSSGSIRWIGLAAMLGTVLSPILAYLWNSYSVAYTTCGRLYYLSLPPELLGVGWRRVARFLPGLPSP